MAVLSAQGCLTHSRPDLVPVHGQVLLKSALQRLLAMAADSAAPEPWPRVHALNMLRLAFSERGLAAEGAAFAAEGVEAESHEMSLGPLPNGQMTRRLRGRARRSNRLLTTVEWTVVGHSRQAEVDAWLLLVHGRTNLSAQLAVGQHAAGRRPHVLRDRDGQR